MDAEVVLNTLLIAAGAVTPEEKARVAWRFNDTLWSEAISGSVSIMEARAFNNLVQDQSYPWVDNLWSAEEVQAIHASYSTTA